jgi:DNA-binding response OmpR family regulator
MMKILLLEDDRILCESLREYLETEGYEVDTAHTGEEVFDKTFDTKYDLYVLDVNVPEVNGFDVLKALKEAGDDTPAIYITAMTDISSIERGFSIGAEDYLKKPFDPEELLIRIKTRYLPSQKRYRVGELEYDPITRTLYHNEKIISLGEVQSNLFHALVTAKGNIVDTYTLMEFLERPNANALRVAINKLKNKLDIPIRNIRGQGYMIEDVRT